MSNPNPTPWSFQGRKVSNFVRIGCGNHKWAENVDGLYCMYCGEPRYLPFIRDHRSNANEIVEVPNPEEKKNHNHIKVRVRLAP